MSIQPLIYHPPLLPGESLPSLLARLAKFNDYEPRGILFTTIRELEKVNRIRGSEKANYTIRLGCPSQTSLFECISALTNISPYGLYRATAHCFTHILTPPEIEIKYLELASNLSVSLLSQNIASKQIRPGYAGQFCPLCLKISAYHRLIWLPIASAACLEHRCLLVNLCPKCGKQIRIQDIIEASCPSCKINLTEVQVTSLKDDSFGLFTQRLIQSWLMEDISPIVTTYSLPQQAPRCLYRIIDGMRFSLAYVTPDWPLLHHINIHQNSFTLLHDSKKRMITPYQSYNFYATACKGIINWPNGFYQFLTAYRNHEKISRHGDSIISNGFRGDLGNLYTNWLTERWKLPALEFVQEAFNWYLIENQTLISPGFLLTRFKDIPQFRDNLCYISMKTATKLLDVSYKKLRFMIQSGLLKSYNEKGKLRTVLMKREEVEALHEKLKQAIGPKEVMKWLGLSNRKIARKLVEVRLLVALQKPTNGYKWMFSPLAVTECLERILCKVQKYTNKNNISEEKMLSLEETSHYLSSKLPLASMAFILQKVAEGKLRAYIPSHQKLLLGNLLFSRNDVDTYVEAVKAEKGWIERDEVIRILEITDEFVAALMRISLVSPSAILAMRHYFDKQAIEKLKLDIIQCAEASKILGVRTKAVCDLVCQGRIEAIRGPSIDGFRHYIFSRESLLKWKSTRITLNEVTPMLHTNKWQVMQWVKHGKIPLPEDGQQSPWYFSLHAIQTFCEDQTQQLLLTQHSRRVNDNNTESSTI